LCYIGISAAKRLSDAGITDLLILEATDHIGGRMHKKNFAGINVEVGANWVEGVNGGKMNPIWPIVNSTLKLRNFRSDFDYLAQNVYKEEYVDYRELMSSANYSVPSVQTI
jgi:polyamine oxidase